MRKRPSFPIGSKLIVIGLLSSVAAACSAGVARFGDDPFSNPFINKSDSMTTGSIRRNPPVQSSYLARPSVRPPSASRIASAPLPAPGSTRAFNAPRIQQAAPSQLHTPVAPAVRTSTVKTGTVAKAIPGWTTKGGTPITLAPGETVETVANRYGVPAAVILHVNGLSSSSQAAPNQRLIIPTYSAVQNLLTRDAVRILAAAAASTPSSNPELHYAFAGDAASEPVEPVSPEVLAFSDPSVNAAPSVKTTNMTAVKKVRSVSSVAAPISIKPPVSIKPPANVATRTAKPVIASAKPAKQPVIAAAKPKPAQRIVAAAPATQRVAKAQPVKAAAAKVAAAAPAKPKLQVATAKSSVASAKSAHVAVAPIQSGKIKTAVAKPHIQTIESSKTQAPKKLAIASRAAPKAAVGGAAAGAIVASRATPKVEAPTPELNAYASDTTATGSLPPGGAAIPAGDNGMFRWPARGRVISSFGSKDVSGTNNGINISMPEGTPVKAAEAGTVAYSGDDVRKYGKLVLIKHENGYVSAYAHNGELDVKKGDSVKRGQMIAKSGATGDVTSPQLHFQLRKGEQPVDPMKLLDAN